MPKIPKKALIVANLLKDDAGGVSWEVKSALSTVGWDAQIFAFKGDPSGIPDVRGNDLIISLGGDGTLLYFARIAGPLSIPILPINLGTLGFIAANRRESWFDTFMAWKREELYPSERLMLRIVAKRGDEELGSFFALNDGVVSSRGKARMIRLCLSVGGSRLGFYRADGLIIATPTGSTAYNLAADGPALHPEMSAMVINPICPFTLASRPLVLQGTQLVEVEIGETRHSGAMLTVDGQESLELRTGDVVQFREAPAKAMLVVPKEEMFISALRGKLGWSRDIDA